MELPSSYEPKDVEEKWYAVWENEKCFHADVNDGKDPFCIVIPPPNVTGSLHMGHALNNTLQDILVRWNRMKGKSALWMPGMDHAGIATQNVVEKLLAKEGKTKHDLGRDSFEKRVWEWKAESGGTIKEQLKRLGASCDWERERFTLDEGLSKAVHRVFVTLYKEGLIYQGHRIINWCPRCQTALSDIETEYKDLDGKLYHIKYPLKDSDKFITVATTRPETMLGDTGVAVNPEDERHKKLIGKTVILPIMEREIPIFADEYVDREFGTGFVKVTPAHDPNDFEMGKRHNLEEINILNDDGTLNENGGKFKGLDRFKARKAVIDELEKHGLLVKIDDHPHSVGHCYRCDTIIEPYYSKQWFVQIKPIAEAAIDAVKEGKINFVPKNWEKTYFEWMYNIRDWCISRQLWWGHRIPAFYCDKCGHINVSETDPVKCEKCGHDSLTQDQDVLDTWFSSGLWPFSTLGWPEETPELKKYYPTSVLVTGFDIIFFWVARMIMSGMKFMNAEPFRDVYIHALVRDEHGHKMSKSRGNVIDPLIMMDRYGTDAFRFTLAVFAAQGRDIILSEKRIEGYRTFSNKIWNATRYILMNLGEDFTPQKGLESDNFELFDKWILSALNRTIRKVNTSLEEYKFNDAANTVYEFYWHDFCDWYLELTKPRLYGTSNNSASAETAKQVLFHVLKKSMQLLHPFMPFITEEIWSKIKNSDEPMVIVSEWPTDRKDFEFNRESEETELFKEMVYKIRNIRGEMNLAPNRKASIVLKTSDTTVKTIAEREHVHFQSLAKVDRITIDPEYVPEKTDASAILKDTEIFIPLKGLIDIEVETARLMKELTRVQADLDKINSKLSNEGFIGKAPEDVIEKEKQKQSELNEIMSKLTAGLENLKSM